MPAVIKPIAQIKRAVTEGLPQDEILGEKAGGQRRAGNGQGGDDIGPVGVGMRALETAHFAHVLFAAEGMNDAAGAEKQTGFEKSMGKHMEDRRAVSAEANGQKHVAQLADRRIGQELS